MEHWGIWSIPLLLSGPLWLWVVETFMVPALDEIELFHHLQMIITFSFWKHTTVYKLSIVHRNT